MAKRSPAQGKPPDLEAICRRVREKSKSYDRYNFSSKYNDFLKAFFDLAQEYDSLEDFYRICVAVPLEITGVASRLYLCQGSRQCLQLVCDSERGVLPVPEPAPGHIFMDYSPYEIENSYVIPIYSKQPAAECHGDEKPDSGDDETKGFWCGLKGGCERHRILGMFEIMPLDSLSEADRFFYGKYTNRIGYNLDNRRIALQNIDHLKFINTLIMDIEHNVIVPNMYFRHLFNKLKKKILKLEELNREIRDMAARDCNERDCSHCLHRCEDLEQDLLRYHGELVKHHANMSLFLESLFRREHFQRGHLVLHPRRCHVEKEVILPQLEHYASRLRAANITIEHPENMLGDEFQILVDVGLLAQVYANLFSNAAKYTREVIDHHGRPRKAMAYGCRFVENYPKPGRIGIKFNVFTTGPNYTAEEGNRLFVEGRRGDDSDGVPGTGHGLSFIRHVIEMHGGTVGYEPTPEGNNFYFILPAPPPELLPELADDAS